MRLTCLLACLVVLMGGGAAVADDTAQPIRHTVVMKEEGRFCGWPANRGIWSWEDEILVGFIYGYYKDYLGGHDIDRDRPSEHKLARSLDGGETWRIEDFTVQAPETGTPQEPYDFTAPGTALNFRGGEWNISQDRGKTWTGPYTLLDVGRPGLLARTDYIVEGPHRVTAFIAAEKSGGGEGQPLCIRTTDGGLTWKLVGWIGEEPPAGYGYAIMPATVSLADEGYLTFIRRAGRLDGRKHWWVEPYVSPDDGQSWYLLKHPRIENGGNPATLTRLKNGNLALAYGWRKPPYGIRARVSKDNGQTWSDEVVLRGDGASWDLGYPRTVQRPDGKCVTVYYFHGRQQPERYIGATIWDPAADYGEEK